MLDWSRTPFQNPINLIQVLSFLQKAPAVGAKQWPGRESLSLHFISLQQPSKDLPAPQGTPTPWLQISGLEEWGYDLRLQSKSQYKYTTIIIITVINLL